MRKIEFRKSGIPRDTKIFVGGQELVAKFDNDAIRQFQVSRKTLTPMFQKNIIAAFQSKLKNEAIELTMAEVNCITTELNDRLDGKIG